MKWTTTSALAALVENGARCTRSRDARKTPYLDLPVLSIRLCGAIDYLRKQHGCDLDRGRLVNIGRIYGSFIGLPGAKEVFHVDE